jgi:hypothetical protein
VWLEVARSAGCDSKLSQVKSIITDTHSSVDSSMSRATSHIQSLRVFCL